MVTPRRDIAPLLLFGRILSSKPVQGRAEVHTRSGRHDKRGRARDERSFGVTVCVRAQPDIVGDGQAIPDGKEKGHPEVAF